MRRSLDCGCCLTDTGRVWCPTCAAGIPPTCAECDRLQGVNADLLAACELALKVIARHDLDMYVGEDLLTDPDGVQGVGDVLRAAIANATGSATEAACATEAEYTAAVRQSLLKAGKRPVKAVYDAAGNCTTCGEAGRCPGWHDADANTGAPAI